MTNVTNTTLLDAINNAGSSDTIKAAKQEYTPRTAEDLRKTVIANVNQTIDALNDFSNENGLSIAKNPLIAPCAKRARIGFQAWIGFGARAESICTWANSEGEQVRFKNFETQEETLNWFDNVLDALELGLYDDLLEAKLEDFRIRAEKGKTARAEKAKERKEAKENTLQAVA
jgi:hypothetical protein